MKCINKISKNDINTAKRTGSVPIGKGRNRHFKDISRILGLCILFLCLLFASGCKNAKEEASEEERLPYVSLYEKTVYNRSLYHGQLYAEALCVAATDTETAEFSLQNPVHAAGLFDISRHKVLYSYKIHDRLFPASTTKLMTALLTLKYGNLNDLVTIGPNAVPSAFEPEAQLCGFEEGDQISLYDLLCGLLMWSGNDSAVAIAEHLCGSVELFAQKMNEEAYRLGATQSHFVNPHGLHQEDHYTTAYDLYLIFNECIKDQRFLDIISMSEYTASVTAADGAVRNPTWAATNFYSAGIIPMPAGVHVFGGKTGTTDEAGSCVILYSQDEEQNPYISVIMGAPDRPELYEEMTRMLSFGISNK